MSHYLKYCNLWITVTYVWKEQQLIFLNVNCTTLVRKGLEETLKYCIACHKVQ